MATWPLPNVKPQGTFNLAPMDQTIRTDMDSGMPRVRRRTSKRLDNFTTSWLMTMDEINTFRDWFDSSTGADGDAGWFVINLPIGTAANSYYKQCICRFKGPGTISHVAGIYWKLDGTLEVQ